MSHDIGCFLGFHRPQRPLVTSSRGYHLLVTTRTFERMTSLLSEQIERWPLDRLIPHARNARTHSEAQVAQIAGSIAEFGFVNPVLVGDDA
jgi:hypothetical protein